MSGPIPDPVAENVPPFKPAWMERLDERDQKEIGFARTYAKHFHHGTAGHLAYLLIDKLAYLLDEAFTPLIGYSHASAFDPAAEPESWLDVAHEGYNSYGDAAGWKNYLGFEMPNWDKLPSKTREYWVAAAKNIWAMARKNP